MVKAEAVPEALQKHWAFHGARMMDKETYRSQEVFYCEGGPHYDAKHSENLSEDDQWMKQGYFMSAWGLKKGKAVIGFPLYFKLNHDTQMKLSERRKSRLNAAKHAAHETIDTMLNVGLLEEYSGSISLPPGHA